MEKHLPGMCKALSLIPCTTQTDNNDKKKKKSTKVDNSGILKMPVSLICMYDRFFMYKKGKYILMCPRNKRIY